MEIEINNICYSGDFSLNKIAEKSGLSIAEIEAIILANKKAEAEKTINKIAAAYQEKIVPSELKEEYKRKEVAARNYLAQSATKIEVAMLEVEAKQYKISVDQHAKAIVKKADELDNSWKDFIDLRAMSKLSVRRARSQKKIEQVLQDLQTKLNKIS